MQYRSEQHDFILLIDLHISHELLEVYLVVMVEIAFRQQSINQLNVLGEFLLVGLQDDLELLPPDLSVVVEVEVLEGEEQVVPAVCGGFGQAGRDELVVGQFAVVINVHALDDLADVSELLPGLLRGHVAR